MNPDVREKIRGLVAGIQAGLSVIKGEGPKGTVLAQLRDKVSSLTERFDGLSEAEVASLAYDVTDLVFKLEDRGIWGLGTDLWAEVVPFTGFKGFGEAEPLVQRDSNQERLQTIFTDIFSGNLKENAGLEKVKAVFEAKKKEIFNLLGLVRKAYQMETKLGEDARGSAQLARLDTPVCGMCLIVGDIMRKAAIEAGLREGYDFVLQDIVYREDKKETTIHSYFILKTTQGDIAVDISAGQYIDDYLDRIAVESDGSYRDKIAKAILQVSFRPIDEKGTNETETLRKKELVFSIERSVGNVGADKDVATVETPTLFKDLQQRPRPVDLIGVTDEEIVRVARKSSLVVDDENLKGYWHNLQGALPYYEDVIRTLLRDYPGYSYVFLGRDAEPLYDATAATLHGTRHEKDVILLPLSSQLIRKVWDNHMKARHFLGQYIDFKAACGKEKKYVVVDTGSVGTSIVWLNGLVSGSHDSITDILEDETEVNGAPLYGLLIQAAKARHMFGDVPGRQLYPQVKLETGKNRFAPEDFRVPQSVRDLARKQYDINYVVASVTQLMPKYTGHVDDLHEEVEGERRILRPVSSEKASDQLLQVEDVILKSNDPFRRGGLLTWHSPINPVAATRIQCAVVNYFASHRSEIYGG